MSINLSFTAAAWIPAAFVAVPALMTDVSKQAHGVGTRGTATTEVDYGQARCPQRIPL
jgi:hypothetical protein